MRRCALEGEKKVRSSGHPDEHPAAGALVVLGKRSYPGSASNSLQKSRYIIYILSY
jgi:hypothetical protein